MQWSLLKLFPQCFGVVLSSDAVAESQWAWLSCQLALDNGVKLCQSCGEPGSGLFCAQCGRRVHDEERVVQCAHCQLEGRGPFCMGCGALILDETLTALETATFDWEAWQQSLTPFLGPLTVQEQRLLHQG